MRKPLFILWQKNIDKQTKLFYILPVPKAAITEAGRGSAPSVEETGNWSLLHRTPHPK
jgi:hypothetical protein